MFGIDMIYAQVVCLEPLSMCWRDNIIKWCHHCTSIQVSVHWGKKQPWVGQLTPLCQWLPVFHLGSLEWVSWHPFVCGFLYSIWAALSGSADTPLSVAACIPFGQPWVGQLTPLCLWLPVFHLGSLEWVSWHPFVCSFLNSIWAPYPIWNPHSPCAKFTLRGVEWVHCLFLFPLKGKCSCHKQNWVFFV